MPPSANTKKRQKIVDVPKECLCGQKFWNKASFGQHVSSCIATIQHTSTLKLHHYAPPREAAVSFHDGINEEAPPSLKQQRLQLITSHRQSEEVNARHIHHQEKYNTQLMQMMKTNSKPSARPDGSTTSEQQHRQPERTNDVDDSLGNNNTATNDTNDGNAHATATAAADDDDISISMFESHEHSDEDDYTQHEHEDTEILHTAAEGVLPVNVPLFPIRKSYNPDDTICFKGTMSPSTAA